MHIFHKILGVYLLFVSSTVMATSSHTQIQQGHTAFQQGVFDQAIQHWEIALKSIDMNSPHYVETMIYLAVAYQKLGNYPLAYQRLQQALPITKSTRQLSQQILVHSHLGDVLLAMQQPEAAKKHLDEGIKLAQPLNEPALLAHLHNNLGNILSVQQHYPEALLDFTKAAELAEQHSETRLQIQALINQAKVYLKQDNFSTSLNRIETALRSLRHYPDTLDKGFQLLSLAKLALTIRQQSKDISTSSLSQLTYQMLQEAYNIATQFQDNRLLAYSKGYLAQLYQQEQRYEEAQQLTRSAIFYAQDLPDLLYYWEWQQGRLFQAQHQFPEAIKAYQNALSHLQPIRTHLIIGQRDSTTAFYEEIRPVYYDLADVLLQQAAATSSQQARLLTDEANNTIEQARLLTEARKTIEQLKIAELQNYFQNECVSEIGKTSLDRLDKHTAVLYPILLTDRTELLLSLPDGIHQFIVPVSSQILTKTVVEFQQNLQKRADFRFIQQSQQLYGWLISPIRSQLHNHNINTLVVVPDGPLRMIPMAALYDSDGKHFLVEDFALATTPGLDLTEPRPLPREQVSVLLSGLSKSVQNFSPLPNVPQEIKNIHTLFEESTVLLDQEYLLDKVKAALQQTPYSIIHIASHGQFNRNPKKTFLLTYDDKLTMDRLENLLSFSQFRQEPVELLTLSACQTAVGDEQSALGLAGVAIKAGARSALASLWFVNDEATSVLISEFYHQLKNPQLSRAQALQNAQKKLIEMPAFRHPAYWGAFLLIGNWL